MRYHALPGTGTSISVIGQGTWTMERDPEASIAALRRGLELGMSHIDTAEMYGSGRVEEVVGKAIAGLRDEVFLASKVMPGNASYRGTIDACEASLRRLGVDYLDLYLLHWPSRYPFEETCRAFEELKSEGKIRDFGVSNFDAGRMKGALSVAGPGRIVCNQVYYELGVRAIEHDLLPLSEQNRVSIVGYSPFGQGRFRSHHPVLREVAESHGATVRQVALSFLVRRPSLFTIPKSSSISHVEENAAAGDLVLTDDEIAAIDRAFPLGRRRKDLPTL